MSRNRNSRKKEEKRNKKIFKERIEMCILKMDRNYRKRNSGRNNRKIYSGEKEERTVKETRKRRENNETNIWKRIKYRKIIEGEKNDK